MIDFEQLNEKAHAAFDAQHEAGYKSAKYVHNHHMNADLLRSEKEAAQAWATKTTVEFWREFYDVAGEAGTKLREIRELANEWQRMINTVTEEMPAGRVLSGAAASIFEILDREED